MSHACLLTPQRSKSLADTARFPLMPRESGGSDRATADAQSATALGNAIRRRALAAVERMPLESIRVTLPGEAPRPLSAQARNVLRDMLTIPPGAAFLDGHVLIYARQNWLTERSDHASPRHLLRLQQELHHAGLIERHVGRNGRRCREEGTGLRLQPLIARLPEIEALIAAHAARAQQLKSLRGAAKTLRGRIAAQIGYLPTRLRDRINDLRARFWPRRLAHLTLAALERHVASLERIIRWLARAVPSFMSDAADSPVRPVTPDQENESEPQGGAEKKEHRPAERDAKQTSESDEIQPQQKAALPGDPRRAPRLNLTPALIADAATPEMRAYLQALHHDSSPARMSEIATERSFDLGLTAQQIDSARRTMSPMRFLMAVLVTDSNRSHPTQPVRVPPAYFHGLMAREREGTLRLDLAIKSIAARVRTGRQSLGHGITGRSASDMAFTGGQ